MYFFVFLLSVRFFKVFFSYTFYTLYYDFWDLITKFWTGSTKWNTPYRIYEWIWNKCYNATGSGLCPSWRCAALSSCPHHWWIHLGYEACEPATFTSTVPLSQGLYYIQLYFLFQSSQSIMKKGRNFSQWWNPSRKRDFL